ncbi:hypothetical protein [Paraburkholderia lacunae]|nr:hypothetical protein [Paraburkholderia lacunae]
MRTLKTTIALAFIAVTTICNASPTKTSLSGEWDWADAPESRTFSIDLKLNGNQIVGQYCAVAQSGNKTDCDDEKNPNLHGELDRAGRSAAVEFTSFFGAKKGKAVLKISKGRLIWHVTQDPVDGEFYAPRDAVMDRH